MTITKKIDERYTVYYSDTHFAFARKKPTISVYDNKENREVKVASFNSKEVFDWFTNLILGR